jgi:hypothetical protein
MANMPGFAEACELAPASIGEQNRPASEPDLRISIIICHSTMRPDLRYQRDVSRSANSVQVVKGREARGRWVEKLRICNGPVV